MSLITFEETRPWARSITSWYDNTTANKNNPDPNQWVGFGDRTVEIVANGQTTTISLRLDPLWIVAPFKDVGINNTPASVRFTVNGAAHQGPPSGFH